ncbi:MAG: flavin reductase family protein [Negativicutes bacterium]|nr:flavin reductase family protein [Negativicutes bacterium]
MEKVKIGGKTFLYPMPVVIVGANVGGKANYITIAYCGIVQHSPAMIAFASGKAHYTNRGIKENSTFSINIPAEGMVEVTDYIGIVSGDKIDKSVLFRNFYGQLASAPMIEECPLNLECRLVKVVDVGGTNDIFIGEIVEAYTSEEFLTDGLPDIKKINPLVFSMHDNNYWQVGANIGRAWGIGKDYKTAPSEE